MAPPMIGSHRLRLLMVLVSLLDGAAFVVPYRTTYP
jgi:hypothetical protein